MASRNKLLLLGAAVAAVAMTAACSNSTADAHTSGTTPANNLSTGANQSSGGTVKIAIVTGVTGGQAPSSEMWLAGVGQAKKDINAAGGILGRQVDTFTLDTRSDPAASVAMMRKALQDKPYAILGTILSSATLVNMDVVQQAGVPQLIGSVSPAITKKNPTGLFETEPNSDLEAQMFANWMVNQAHAQKIAFIFSDDEFGVSGEKSFASLAKKAGAQVVAEVSTQVGQTDFAGDVAKIQQAKPDTVFMYMHETETGRFLQQAQSAGLKNGTIRFLGASSALAQSTVQLAGSAADGVEGFVPYSASAPSMVTLGKEYEDSHGGKAPDHNYFKGYMSLWSVAYATQDIGKFDQKGLIDDLKSKTFCVSKYPNLLESTKWDQSGNIDRSTFVVKIQDQKQAVVDTIKPLNEADFASCGS